MRTHHHPSTASATPRRPGTRTLAMVALLGVLCAAAGAADHCCHTSYGNYNSNQKGQHFKGSTYWVFSGTGSDVLDPHIGRFDHATGAVTTRKIANAPSDMVSKLDDHGNPVMLVDSRGYIHVVFGGHGAHRGDQRYFRSARPEDITAFDAVNNIPNQATYPNLLEMADGDLALFYRGAANHRSDWYLIRSSTGGDSWTSPLAVLAGGRKRTDGKYFEGTYWDGWYGPDVMYPGVGGDLHFVFAYHACADDYSHYEHGERRVSIFHALRKADGSWRPMAGRSLSLPLTREVLEQHCTVVEAADKRGRDVDSTYPQGMTVDAAGHPHLLYRARRDSDPRYSGDLELISWTGSGWGPIRSLPTRSGGFVETTDGAIHVYARKHYRSTNGGADWTAIGPAPENSTHPIHNADPNVRCLVYEGDDPASKRRVYLWGDQGYITPGVPVGGTDPGPGPDPDPDPNPAPGPVTADSWQDPHVPMNVIDGDPATRWSAEGAGHWIQWDLGTVQPVAAVQIAWFRGDQRRSRFALELSNDGDAWRSIFDGESSGQTTALEAYAGDGSQARYLRITGFGNSDNAWTSITEVAVDSSGDSDPGPGGDPVIADIWQDPHVPMNVIDGDLGTRWSAEGAGHWLRWDLGAVQPVAAVQVAWFRGDQRRSRFAIELSSDGEAWRSIFDGESSGQTSLAEAYPGDGLSARYLRITGFGNSDNAWNSITEVSIDGSGASLPGSQVLPLLRDTYVRSGAYRAWNFGQDPELIVKQSSSDYSREIYLGFDCSAALTAGEATLSLRVEAVGDDAASTDLVVELMRPGTALWSEDTLTWGDRPTEVLATSSTVRCSAQVGEDWTIDVSELIQAAHDAGIPERSTLRIRSTQSGGQRYIVVASDEAAGTTGPRLVFQALAGNG
jgi:hypothetical protein